MGTGAEPELRVADPSVPLPSALCPERPLPRTCLCLPSPGPDSHTARPRRPCPPPASPLAPGCLALPCPQLEFPEDSPVPAPPLAHQRGGSGGHRGLCSQPSGGSGAKQECSKSGQPWVRVNPTAASLRPTRGWGPSPTLLSCPEFKTRPGRPPGSPAARSQCLSQGALWRWLPMSGPGLHGLPSRARGFTALPTWTPRLRQRGSLRIT